MKEKSWRDKFVKCPFYSQNVKNKIVCEGLISRTTLHIVFVRDEDKKSYLNALCCSIKGYHNCPYAKILEEKYNDEE